METSIHPSPLVNTPMFKHRNSIEMILNLIKKKKKQYNFLTEKKSLYQII